MVMMVMMTTAMHNRHGAYIKSCENSNFSARRLVVTVHWLSKLFKESVPAIASPLNSRALNKGSCFRPPAICCRMYTRGLSKFHAHTERLDP